MSVYPGVVLVGPHVRPVAPSRAGQVLAWVHREERLGDRRVDGLWTQEFPSAAAAWRWVADQVLAGGVIDWNVGGQRRLRFQ